MKFSIQFKMVIIFSFIIFICLSGLLLVTYTVTEKNMHETIHQDMISAKTNLDIYVQQYFMVHTKKISEASLYSERNELAKELTNIMNGKVFISDTAIDGTTREDTKVDSDISYRIIKDKHNMLASLIFPIYQGDTEIGSLNFEKNYNELNQRNESFLSIIKMFATVIFCLVFIASIFLSRMITRPVRQLTERSGQVALGNFNADIQINPTKDEIGELAHRFQIMIKHIQEQIKVIEQERDEVKKAQARSKFFFDNVTHELKTPLTAIQGYAQIVKENEFTDKTFFDKGLNYIIRESHRLNGMVVKLLELSQSTELAEDYHFEKLNVSKVVNEACEDMKMKANKYSIQIDCNAQDSLYLLGDQHKIKAALLNIIDNSIKYGDVASIVTVQAYKEEQCVVIEVKDRGEGIASEHVEHVFDPFYRGVIEGEKGSAGLGLAIVKKVIEDHGGKVELSSEAQIGTVVKMSLPGIWE